MTNKSLSGALGEDIAAEYLKSLSWKIVERNFRKPWGEIDIIAKEPDGTLVFVEVKTMHSSGLLNPEDNLTGAKFKKISRTASLYAGSSDALVDERGWRIDLVAITLDQRNRSLGKEGIRHYQNVARG